MSSSDLLLIVGCLVLGYGLVSMALRKPGRPPAAPPPPPPSPPSAGEAVAPMPPQWSRVLGLPPDASAEDIRDAYRRLISQYHPDKVATLGQELRDLAERKSREITAAYQDGLMARREAP